MRAKASFAAIACGTVRCRLCWAFCVLVPIPYGRLLLLIYKVGTVKHARSWQPWSEILSNQGIDKGEDGCPIKDPIIALPFSGAKHSGASLP